MRRSSDVATELPASTVEQNPSPAVAVNFPVPHGEQLVPSPLLPMPQVAQVVAEPSTVLINSPEEHIVQEEAPSLLKPTTQGVLLVPSPLLPLGHRAH